jgi:hypothetical protein
VQLAAFVLFLAGIYTLPDAGRFPAPDAPAKARLDRALRALQAEEGEAADRAVRDLALLGEVVLPAVARRLNEADAGERLLLLAAVSRMPRAQPLLVQARRDPHAAVRAWVAGPPPRARTDLRRLAGRYLDLLGVAEQKLRDEADEDLRRFEERLGLPEDTLEQQRRRMSDRKLAESVQKERDRVARLFARAGRAALRSGALAPDLSEPVFVAYLGLLREEGWTFYHAMTALVALGEKVAPALEQLLDRPHHDARKVIRLLSAVRPDGGRGLYARFDRHRPEVARALVVLAPNLLEHEALVALLERAALAEDGTVRAAALDGLLDLDAPAGREAARRLLDPALYGRTEFTRATRLVARCGDLELLEQYASVEIPDDRSERAKQLSRLRSTAMSALRGAEGPEVEALGARLLEAKTAEVRTLGIDLVRDPQALLAYARAEPQEDLVKTAVSRALGLHGAGVAREALALLRERGLATPHRVIQELKRTGSVALLLELATGASEDERRAALRALGDLPRIDAQHERTLLDLHARAPDPLRKAALGALLPLGTDAVRRRYEEAGEEALARLYGRAEVGHPIPFAFPLRRYLAGATATRLQTLARIAEALPAPEPRFFFDLLQAWDALNAGERVGEGIDAGAAQQKVKLLDALARSSDRASARKLFDLLVTGKTKDPSLVLGTLKAAARLLPPEQLARLLPILREQVKGEHPLADRLPPPHNELRLRLLFGSINALAHARVEAALDDLCALVLDPQLHLPAFDWKHESFAWRAALQALRHFPASAVEPAFRRALAEAEADGRLAALHPARLFDAVGRCRQGRWRGRWLAEVAVALCEVLERLPWEGEVTYQRAIALGTLRRYAEAAAAAREGARRKRALGYTPEDGFYTPAFLEGRALIYEALAAGSVAQFRAALPRFEGDPFLLSLAAWNLRFDLPDLALAAQASEEAVRRSAGLFHTFRNTLASIRLAQGRPKEALDLLDPHRRLPVKREEQSMWFLLFRAQTHRMLGDDVSARHDLELAVAEDRRLLPYARSLPELAAFADVFREADAEFFDELFR